MARAGMGDRAPLNGSFTAGLIQSKQVADSKQGDQFRW